MNVLMLAGRVCADAETRHTANGSTVVGYTVASDVGYGDRKHPVFVRVSDWRKGNEKLAPYITKGLPVTVTGEMDVREYETSDGEKRTSVELRLQSIELQGGKRDEQAEPQRQVRPQAAPEAAEAADIAQSEADFGDDDIPF